MTAAVPFPSETEVDLESPSAAEVEIITRALATGASGPVVSRSRSEQC